MWAAMACALKINLIFATSVPSTHSVISYRFLRRFAYPKHIAIPLQLASRATPSSSNFAHPRPFVGQITPAYVQINAKGLVISQVLAPFIHTATRYLSDRPSHQFFEGGDPLKCAVFAGLCTGPRIPPNFCKQVTLCT